MTEALGFVVEFIDLHHKYKHHRLTNCPGADPEVVNGVVGIFRERNTPNQCCLNPFHQQ